nr:hypothetical protein HmN_000724600 [Hymenolepis microstoma]
MQLCLHQGPLKDRHHYQCKVRAYLKHLKQTIRLGGIGSGSDGSSKSGWHSSSWCSDTAAALSSSKALPPGLSDFGTIASQGFAWPYDWWMVDEELSSTALNRLQSGHPSVVSLHSRERARTRRSVYYRPVKYCLCGFVFTHRG